MNLSHKTSISRREACRRMLGLAGGASLAGMTWNPGRLFSDEINGNVKRVEEDWYVQIGVPSPIEDAPQITSVIAPSWHLEGNYAVFDLNCATQPNFESGGVQLQHWYDDAIVQSKSNTNWDSLHIADEEIRYTSRMSVKDGKLIFEIVNGNSESWGTFGTGELKLQTATWRSHLGWYSPDYSVANSRVGYASHRVRKFALQKIRLFNGNDELISEDTTPRVLHEYTPSV